MRAAEEDHLECVKFLAGEEEEREASHFTDLIVAAVCGDANGVKRHIDQAGQKAADGATALIYAAVEGHLECVKILAPLEKGMDDEDEETALMYAAMMGHLECVKFLAPEEAGMRDDYGETAMIKSDDDGKAASFLSPFEAGLIDNNEYNQTILVILSC